MKFDIVVGNPPYNNDIYIPFVELGHKLAKQCSCFITPAKWQAKGGQKNEQFRAEIVPHMSKVVFYPDCLDVFGISEPSGIAFYLIDKNVHTECEIKNISVLAPIINSVQIRNITNKQSLWNCGNTIVERIRSSSNYKPYKLNEVTKLKTYTINVNKQLLNCLSRVWDWNNGCIKPEYIGKGGCTFDGDGKAKVFGNPKVITDNNDNSSGTSINIFTTDSVEEGKSFISWMYSKFVGFLIIINKYAQNMMKESDWRFVPDPGAFDHIFTDEELYKKYNLTDEEINIIESVIKERK